MIHLSWKICVCTLLTLASSMYAADTASTTDYGPRLSDNEPLDVAFHSDEYYDYARGVYEQGFGEREQRPARHVREVVFLKKTRLFFVRDTLEPLDGKPHFYQALFHLDTEHLDVNKERGIVETQDPDTANIRIVPQSDRELKTNIIQGQETPVVQGWLPRGHGIRGVRPIPTVVYERKSANPIHFLSVLQPLQDGREDRVSAIVEKDRSIRIIYVSGQSIDVGPMLR